MESRRYLRCLLPAIFAVFVILFGDSTEASENYGLSVRPTKSWRFLGRNEETVPQMFRENIEEFSVGRIECLRYCVQSSTEMDEAPHVLRINWTLDNNHEMGSTTTGDKGFVPEILQGKSIKSDVSRNSQSACTFSIVIGCELLQEQEDNFNKIEKSFIKSLQPNLDVLEDLSDNDSPQNLVNEKLVDKSNLINQTKQLFYVRKNQAEMNVVVLGNISKINLEMPIAMPSLGGKTPRLTLATSARMPGLRLSVLNPPSGDYHLELRGEDGQSYRMIVVTSAAPEISSRDVGLDGFMVHAGEVSALGTDNRQSIYEDLNANPRQIRVLKENIDRSDVVDDSGMNHDFSARMISENYPPDTKSGQVPFKFPIDKNDLEFREPINITMRMDSDIQDRVLNRNSHELDDLSRSLDDELPMKKYLIIDINPNSNLVANPGTVHQVMFDITNNHILPIRHYFQASSTPLRILSVRPGFGFVEIAPGQTATVIVDLQIPPVSESIVNKLTLRVQGIQNLEKSANIYVRTSGSNLYDEISPTIYYYFNNNCAGKTSAEKCLKSYWSVDITIQDSDSGLRSVTSAPKGVYPRSQYTSGTSSPVHFYYSNNCCNRVVEVSATDIAGKVTTRKIDVGEWYNLTEGEIAAVVVGTLFIILLIILIVILILYCCNRKESHDLPYSQRYGTRSPPRSE